MNERKEKFKNKSLTDKAKETENNPNEYILFIEWK